MPSFEKISPTCQDNSPQAGIANSSSRKAVSFSSERTTKRFPSPRCASAIQIVRPLESIAETQPQLQPALLRLSAIISPVPFQSFGADKMPEGTIYEAPSVSTITPSGGFRYGHITGGTNTGGNNGKPDRNDFNNLKWSCCNRHRHIRRH